MFESAVKGNNKNIKIEYPYVKRLSMFPFTTVIFTATIHTGYQVSLSANWISSSISRKTLLMLYFNGTQLSLL
jgi:hypothetical protein